MSIEPWRDLWLIRVAVNEGIRQLCRPIFGVPAEAGMEFADQVVARAAIRSALSGLSRRRAQVVALRHLVGLSEQEVPFALNLSHGSVKTHLRRGL